MSSIKTTPKERIFLLIGDIEIEEIVRNTIYMIIAKYMTTIKGENCKHDKWHELRKHCV